MNYSAREPHPCPPHPPQPAALSHRRSHLQRARSPAPISSHAIFDAYAAPASTASWSSSTTTRRTAPARSPTSWRASHRITVIHRAGKLGLGTAVVEGFEAASAPIVGVIDADLSHPPELLPRMLAVMQPRAADIVIGSRYIPGGGTRNWAIGAAADVAVRLPAGARPDAGARRDLRVLPDAPRSRARRPHLRRRLQDLPGAADPRRGPRSVVEVPYVFEGRTAGESKMNLQGSARLPRAAARPAALHAGRSRRCASATAAHRRSASAEPLASRADGGRAAVVDDLARRTASATAPARRSPAWSAPAARRRRAWREM